MNLTWANNTDVFLCHNSCCLMCSLSRGSLAAAVIKIFVEGRKHGWIWLIFDFEGHLGGLVFLYTKVNSFYEYANIHLVLVLYQAEMN